MEPDVHADVVNSIEAFISWKSEILGDKKMSALEKRRELNKEVAVCGMVRRHVIKEIADQVRDERIMINLMEKLKELSNISCPEMVILTMDQLKLLQWTDLTNAEPVIHELQSLKKTMEDNAAPQPEQVLATFLLKSWPIELKTNRDNHNANNPILSLAGVYKAMRKISITEKANKIQHQVEDARKYNTESRRRVTFEGRDEYIGDNERALKRREYQPSLGQASYLEGMKTLGEVPAWLMEKWKSHQEDHKKGKCQYQQCWFKAGNQAPKVLMQFLKRAHGLRTNR
jgi:hypothetical protein